MVDTSVWSLALRRRNQHLSQQEQLVCSELAELISEGRVQIIGPIRQELLSGIREDVYYRRVRGYLRTFDDDALSVEDFEQAAAASNKCRAAGVSGSPFDLLICAVAIRHNWSIFTTDQNFIGYARHLPIRLYTPRF